MTGKTFFERNSTNIITLIGAATGAGTVVRNWGITKMQRCATRRKDLVADVQTIQDSTTLSIEELEKILVLL